MAEATEGRDQARAHSLQCMEIWGGAEAIDDYVSVPGIDVHVYCRPYRDQTGGGDIHYVSTCAAGNISRTVLADVSGHGEAVNELATSLRRLMRKHINTPDQSRFLRSLNEEFTRLSEHGNFATALLATYFAPTDHLIITNAGHPRPLWYHGGDGSWRVLEPEAASGPTGSDGPAALNLPLGVIEPTTYEQFAVWLARGDIVVLYSDAFTEARGPDGELLGEERLLEMARALDVSRPETIGPALLRRIEAYAREGSLDDDATLIVLHHNAADPPELSLKDRMHVLGRMLGLGD